MNSSVVENHDAQIEKFRECFRKFHKFPGVKYTLFAAATALNSFNFVKSTREEHLDKFLQHPVNF